MIKATIHLGDGSYSVVDAHLTSVPGVLVVNSEEATSVHGRFALIHERSGCLIDNDTYRSLRSAQQHARAWRRLDMTRPLVELNDVNNICVKTDNSKTDDAALFTAIEEIGRVNDDDETMSSSEFEALSPYERGWVVYMYGCYDTQPNVPNETNPYDKRVDEHQEWVSGAHDAMLAAQDADD